MGMSQLRIIFFMGAMNKMLEFMVTHGETHRECQSFDRISFPTNSYRVVFISCALSKSFLCFFFFYISASEELLIEAEQKGERC